jgi:RND family efflux transporter MFP subunit
MISTPKSFAAGFAMRILQRLFLPVCAITLAVSFLLSGCGSGDQQHNKQLYTCGMHPQVVQDRPGNCPICGMKLTPIRKQPGAAGAINAASMGSDRRIAFYKSTMNPGEISPKPAKDSMGMDMVPVYADEAASGSTAIAVDAGTVQKMDIRTGLVRRGRVRRVIRTVGAIDFDETAMAEVSTKFRGWVEKLYVDSTGKQMHKGDPLFEIYSPELYLAQTEYLLTLNSSTNHDTAASALRKTAATTKLRYWDISEDQIAELERSRAPKKTLRMNAPRDGIVVEKFVEEGQMVEPGMKLYRLADLASVWIQAQVYEQDLPFIKLGQEATVTLASLPDPKFRGRVTYIYPMVDEKTRTAKVRMEFHNPGYFLKPGMYATVEIAAELSPSAVLVPDMAVLRSGEQNTVFVALDGGRFEPRKIELGPRSEGGFYEVASGLREGERVVTSGQFMLDSESQLREAIQKMTGHKPGEPSSSAPAEMPSATPSGTNAPISATQEIVYICPMPEHVSLEYTHAGNCPLCGMTLVPVSRQMLARIQPGGQVEFYTCPMPEHSDVHQDKPGKCPKCGMTLIPVMSRPRLAAPGVSVPGDATHEPVAKLYTCPMAEHAHVVSDKPGVCPECGMELVETSKVNHGPQAEENWRRKHRTTP